MTRSVQHTPIFGITLCRSEKADKRIWHSRFRARERDNLTNCEDWDAYITTHILDVSNPWSMGKDGRRYIGPHPLRKKWMRK